MKQIPLVGCARPASSTRRTPAAPRRRSITNSTTQRSEPVLGSPDAPELDVRPPLAGGHTAPRHAGGALVHVVAAADPCSTCRTSSRTSRGRTAPCRERWRRALPSRAAFLLDSRQFPAVTRATAPYPRYRAPVSEDAEVEVVRRAAIALLSPLAHAAPDVIAAALEPRDEDYAAVFLGDAAARARAAFRALWSAPPAGPLRAAPASSRPTTRAAGNFRAAIGGSLTGYPRS